MQPSMSPISRYLRNRISTQLRADRRSTVVHRNISETDFDADAADAIEVDDREGLMYSYIHEDEDWLLVLVRFEDGTFAAVDATGTDEDTVLAIVTSLSTEAAARQAGLQPAP